jgi:hypothetical protein
MATEFKPAPRPTAEHESHCIHDARLCRECAAIPIPQPRETPEWAEKYVRPGDDPFNIPMLVEARMVSEYYRDQQKTEVGAGYETPKDRYLAYHKSCCDRLVEITAKKNADYTGTDPDPFANFTRVESLGIASTEQGFLTRMVDKICRISSYVQKGTLQVNDESVEDTLLDLANYSILLAGYIKSKKEKV